MKDENQKFILLNLFIPHPLSFIPHPFLLTASQSGGLYRR